MEKSSSPKDPKTDVKEANAEFVPNIPSKNPLSGVSLGSSQPVGASEDSDNPDQFEEMKNRKLVTFIPFSS